MKKILIIVMAAMLCVSLLACGAEADENLSAADKATVDFEIEIPEIDLGEIETYGEVEGAQIQFDIPEFSIPEIETLPPLVPATINFELPEMIFKIDIETFDMEDYKNEMSFNIDEADLEKVEAMEVEEVVQIAELKTNLLLDLKFAFEKAGLTVQIDETTGEIALDAAVLFGTDESAVSEEGKVLLQQFMEVYSYVLLHERYEGFISQVIVEGHTDTQGEYDYNLKLSQDRADSVRQFCLSEECGIAEQQRSELESLLKAVGYSYDKPIYDESGEVDMAASRRVTFRFLINID